MNAIQLNEIIQNLPDWYKTYITYYYQYKCKLMNFADTMDSSSQLKNRYWEAMAYLIPYQFEDYAIVLHQPTASNKMITNIESYAYSRQEIYKFLNIQFGSELIDDLEAYSVADAAMWRNEKRTDLFTDDLELNGMCNPKQFDYIVSKIASFSKDLVIYHYDILKCITHSLDFEIASSELEYRLFQGHILNYSDLVNTTKINTQPTGFFSIDGSWAVITDYDQPYTYIGGKKSLIDSLLSSNHDMYRISPKYVLDVSSGKKSHHQFL